MVVVVGMIAVVMIVAVVYSLGVGPIVYSESGVWFAALPYMQR